MPLLAFRPSRRTAGISARRMAVRPDVPWYWRSLRVAAGVAVIGALAWGLFRVFGTDLRGRETSAELARLQEQVQHQETELAELRPWLTQADRQMQIDRAAAADLARQVKSLAFENAALKEDLAFFQSIMSSQAGGEGSISVNRFRLQPEAAAGEFRYQMLLVQPGQRVREFHGTLQFVLDVQQDGHKLVLVLPPDAERGARDYQLNFRFFQRIEGTFKLTPGSVLKGMQVRVFENGARTPKLTQILNVS
jgi:hypothetical protein